MFLHWAQSCLTGKELTGILGFQLKLALPPALPCPAPSLGAADSPYPAGPFGDPRPLLALCALGSSWPALWQDQKQLYKQNENVCSFCRWLIQITKPFHLFLSFGLLPHKKLTLEKVCSYSGLHFPDPQSFSVSTNTSLFYRGRIVRIASHCIFFLER